MVQKSQTTTWDGAKTLVNNGIQLPPSNWWVSRISKPSTVSFLSAQGMPPCLCFHYGNFQLQVVITQGDRGVFFLVCVCVWFWLGQCFYKQAIIWLILDYIVWYVWNKFANRSILCIILNHLWYCSQNECCGWVIHWWFQMPSDPRVARNVLYAGKECRIETDVEYVFPSSVSNVHDICTYIYNIHITHITCCTSLYSFCTNEYDVIMIFGCSDTTD